MAPRVSNPGLPMGASYQRLAEMITLDVLKMRPKVPKRMLRIGANHCKLRKWAAGSRAEKPRRSGEIA